jgi:acetyl-CoA C-acetyltransferase
MPVVASAQAAVHVDRGVGHPVARVGGPELGRGHGGLAPKSPGVALAPGSQQPGGLPAGARLLATLVHALERTGGRYGLVTMCEGGGQANVTIIERA